MRIDSPPSYRSSTVYPTSGRARFHRHIVALLATRTPSWRSPIIWRSHHRPVESRNYPDTCPAEFSETTLTGGKTFQFGVPSVGVLEVVLESQAKWGRKSRGVERFVEFEVRVGVG